MGRNKGRVQTSLTLLTGGRHSGVLSAHFHSNNERKKPPYDSTKISTEPQQNIPPEKQLHFYLRYLCVGSRRKAALRHLLSINKVKLK